jgi:Ca2+/H+ antiporter
MEYVFEYALPVALFMATAYAIKLFLEAKTRHKLIEKGMVDEKIKLLFPKPPEAHSASLKWGMVLLGIGIAFLVGQFLPEEISEGVTVSTAIIMAGLGLLIFYAIKGRADSNDRGNPPGI